jgi:hypothetical protein
MKANRDRPVGIQIQNEVVHAGLTKREYFAAHALAGMLANPGHPGNCEDTAIACARYADAALMALDGDIK